MMVVLAQAAQRLETGNVQGTHSPVIDIANHRAAPMAAFLAADSIYEHAVEYVLREGTERRDRLLPRATSHLLDPLQHRDCVRAPPANKLSHVVDVEVLFRRNSEQSCGRPLPYVVGRNQAFLAGFRK